MIPKLTIWRNGPTEQRWEALNFRISDGGVRYCSQNQGVSPTLPERRQRDQAIENRSRNHGNIGIDLLTVEGHVSNSPRLKNTPENYVQGFPSVSVSNMLKASFTVICIAAFSTKSTSLSSSSTLRCRISDREIQLMSVFS